MSGYFGALSSPAENKLVVSGAPPGVVFDMADVVRMTPLDQAFWRQLDGSVNLGFTFTQADQRLQWSFDAGVTRTTAKFVTRANFDAILTVEDTDSHQNRNTSSVAVERQIGRRWFTAVFGQADHNEELGLDVRALGGLGLGRSVFQTNRVILAPYAGLTYTQERYTDEPVSNLLEAVAGVRADWFTFGDYQTDLIFLEQTFFDLNNSNRVRVEMKTTFKQEVLKDLYWNLSLLESFNGAPPTGQKKNDLTLSMSLGWSF